MKQLKGNPNKSNSLYKHHNLKNIKKYVTPLGILTIVPRSHAVRAAWNNNSKNKKYILFPPPFPRNPIIMVPILAQCATGQFTKKVFSDLADEFNIALVDCSTDFSFLSTRTSIVVYTFELQQSLNQTIFPSISKDPDNFFFFIFCYCFSPSLQPCQPWPWEMEKVLKLL